MAKDRTQDDDYVTPLRRMLVSVLVLVLFAIFLVWRIDSPRVERFRSQVIDRVMPQMDWAMAPVTGTINLLRDFQSYSRIYDQNQELRRELQQMKAWKEAALQLEQENARLLDLNNVRLDPRLTYITGVVMADSGSPYRQSVLLNIGARDGIVDGWAAMDGIGLVGRISGVGQQISRVILLTDTSSRLPVIIQPSGQTAMIMGNNTAAPPIDFLENPDLVRPGDRVISSGDGAVFPAGLLVGQVAEDANGRLRVRLAADYERLEYLRVLRHLGTEDLSDPGSLIAPLPDLIAPLPGASETDPSASPDAEGQPALPPAGAQATGGTDG
ncbi:rod shape-determining protein MreC [Pseudooceanicola sediminis]|uniref:Cell shape-determining protein MreC n=1 Tax=Pseudooceanicola sediminis TaxID=2211117 RepID=A0A399IXM8_9RHOB|nr:rod shape-determining protein MreC [Pseudooceanicola sediminis]RII37933.1 rod shape-determining protein MreC [Pseudooceanicola sediminis]|tara:strand:- start:40428 stop:41408 length:981 start_codon:yes stop_codon:yes gene_type:complete